MPGAIVAAITPPGGSINPFSSPPSHPRINDPHAPKPPPLPKFPRRRGLPPLSTRIPKLNPNRSLKPAYVRFGHHQRVPVAGGVLDADDDRSIIVGDSGVSYHLPGAPFGFQYSYSETPKVMPLALREPAFLPFAPPTMPRPWTGKAPIKSKKEKALRKQRKVRLMEVDNDDDDDEEGPQEKVMVMARPVKGLVQRGKDGRSREEILGKPLSKKEISKMLEPYISSNRQVNLGRDGLTHNMLEFIHCHWKHHPICKVRCRGVPTVDMDNVCQHLEEKTWGKIVHHDGGVIYLFRGRNYNPWTRPRFPVMLWKPAAPVYPKLIQPAPDGLTLAEADDLRAKGQSLLPICKLAKNGIYINLVKEVRDAFEENYLVKINCHGLDRSDYKKIGAKLKDLVPCVLLSFDDEQILMWRGKNWKSRYPPPQIPSSIDPPTVGSADNSENVSTYSTERKIASPRMLALWNHAIESKKAFLLDATALSPDALLAKVEEFSSVSQDSSFAPASDGGHLLEEQSDESDINDEADDNHLFEESSVPFGSIPLDAIAMQLDQNKQC